MKKTLKGYILGFLSAAILVSGVSYAANTVRIVIDGQELIPRDADGNRVDPIIVDGTTYLPVRAVANAFGKEVYWDGPNYTVYLGNMNGQLAYPSKEVINEDSIGRGWRDAYGDQLKDNYGNRYSRSIRSTFPDNDFEVLCNYKYSKIKGTIYIVNGYSNNFSGQIIIKTDGKTVYTSNELDKRSSPINLDVNITGCNHLEIICTGDIAGLGYLCIGDLGLYQ